MLFPLGQRGSGVEIVTIEVGGGQLDDEILKFIDFYVTEKMEQIGMGSGFDTDSVTFIYHQLRSKIEWRLPGNI